jgi:hypothetical protein
MVSGAAAAEPPADPDPAGPSTFGQRGLVRSWAALPNGPGSLVIGSSLEFFKASDFIIDGDDNQRLMTRFTVSAVPIEGLEINAGFSMVMNNNPAFAPEQSQTIGDPFLGVRYGMALTGWISLGAGIQCLAPTGERFSELSTDGISTRLMLLADFRPVPEMLLMLNLGYHFDNSRELFGGDMTGAQRFAAGVNPHDQLLVHLGAAWQIGPLAPFLEYGTAQALGADGMSFTDSPNWLTVGVRAWPLSHHALHLLAAVDIGLAGIHLPVQKADKARTPPYNLILGVGYDFGAVPEPEPKVEVREVVRVEKVEVPAEAPTAPKPIGRIAGQVLDAETGKPLGGARVAVSGRESSILQSDPEQGKFFTCPSEPGPVKLVVSREGYREESKVVLVQDQPEVPAIIKLTRATGKTFGRLKGTVRAARTGRPLRALISIPARQVKVRAARRTGKFELKLATGLLDVIISKPGFITQRSSVKLEAGDLVILNVELHSKK